MRIGPYTLRNPLIVAPMAGVTDRPFRQLCKRLGAAMAVSEMVTSNSLLYGSAKTRRRADHEGETAPISVQIAGADPAMMAEAARYNADRGAQIIDINMGARIPVSATGDRATTRRAAQVLRHPGADAVMIGRAAMGRPWLFREIAHYLATGERLPAPEVAEIHRIMLGHLDDLYRFYGEYTGVRMARKHIAWYSRGLADSAGFRHAMNRLDTTRQQIGAVDAFFRHAAERNRRPACADDEALVLASA